MKLIFYFIIATSLLTHMACKDEGPAPTSIYEYHAQIHQPSAADKHIGDTLQIEVDFESQTGEPVHHINVRIFNKSTNVEVYNKPDEPHVHDVSGMHAFEDQFILSAANGLSDGDWVLEAKVWGHEDGLEETTERVEFLVHN